MIFAHNDFSYKLLAIGIILLIWIPWLWRYQIKPYFATININQRLKKHPEWKKIKKTEKFLISLYRRTNSYRVSLQERKRLAYQETDYIYGEIEFLTFFTILEKVKPQPGEIFYDLGCGSGKAVFTAALFFDLSKARGIESLPKLYEIANNQLKKSKILIQSYDKDFQQFISNKISHIQFFNENFLNFNFTDADIVFVNATCMSYFTWSLILEKLLLLKPGSRVIVNTKKIKHEKFDLLNQSMELMSWGINSVNIYIKK